MTERERLFKDLKGLPYKYPIVYRDDEIISIVADFILADRKRIVEPLVKYKLFRSRRKLVTAKSFINDAIDQTLKNAGIEDK